MKINNKNKDFSTKFDFLEAGDVFSYCGDIYMKTSCDSFDAVDLKNGRLVKFGFGSSSSIAVNYFENAELVIDN